jgi:hypothetical protein
MAITMAARAAAAAEGPGSKPPAIANVVIPKSTP